MENSVLLSKCKEVLEALCVSIGERPVGSEGNRKATAYVEEQFRSFGLQTETPGFDAIDWLDGGASLRCGDASLREGPSAFSLFDLPEDISSVVSYILQRSENIVEGIKWPQGDHSIFLQYGVPAIAVSSNWFTENIDKQDITHGPKDNIQIVDCRRLAERALVLGSLVRRI